MKASVSVTEVRNALRCPRIFALGRMLGQSVAFPVGTSSLGATFHRVVERFGREVTEAMVNALAIRPAIGALRGALPGTKIEPILVDWLLAVLSEELEAAPRLWSMPAEVDDLAEALRELAFYLALELSPSPKPPAEALADLLRGVEEEVFSVIHVGEESTLVTGRADAIFARPGPAYDVVEYKLTDEDNEALDRAQVALYRHLLAESTGTDASAVILRFLPSLKVTRLEPGEADALVHKTIYPLLAEMIRWEQAPESAPPPERQDICPACPVRADCVQTYPGWLACRDQPPAGAQRPRPKRDGQLPTASVDPPLPVPFPTPPEAAGDPTYDEEAAWLAKKIVEVFKRRRVPAQAKAPVVGARTIAVEVTVKSGSIKAIDGAADDVLHQLQSSHEIVGSFSKEGARRLFRIARREPRRVELSDLLAQTEDFLRERAGRFVVGEAVDGTVLIGDLGDAASPHLLVGGTTGSGKSVLLRALATSLIHFHGPEALQLTLIDPKRVSFQRFAAQVGAHLARPLAYDVAEALVILQELVDEMRERYDLFARASVNDLDEYNEVRAPQDRLPRQVVIIDEFQDLVIAKDTKEPFFDVVRQLGAMARAAGIHLILATQRPDRTVVPGQIKGNLPGRIALRVQSKVNSNIILDAPGAEQLLGTGDLLADLGRGLVRAQAAFV